MIELTYGAQARLEEYLRELRSVLAGAPSVDTEEVERDVRDHIESALADKTAPVEASVLDGVLKDLGAPHQWLPENGKQQWYQKSLGDWRREIGAALRHIGQQLASGPESYRFAALSFLLLNLVFITPALMNEEKGIPLMFAMLFSSFVLARASLSLYGPALLTLGQKWLMYPVLLLVYVPLAGMLLLGPTALGGAIGIQSVRGRAVEQDTAARIKAWKIEQDEVKNALNAVIASAKRQPNSLTIELPRLKQTVSGTPEELKLSLTARQQELGNWIIELKKVHEQSWPRQNLLSFLTPLLPTTVELPVLIGVLIVLTGCVWLLEGIVWMTFPNAVRNIFYPFAERTSRRSGMWLTLMGGILSFGLLLFMGAFRGMTRGMIL